MSSYFVSTGCTYENLKNGYIAQNETSQKRKVPVKLIQVDSNTGQDWQRATPKSDTGDAELHIYEVPVLNEDNLLAEIQNLQYFFLRANRSSLRKDRKAYALLINVDDRTLYRVQAFLALQVGEKSPYDILFRKRKDPFVYPLNPNLQEMDFGNLLPLLCVTARPSKFDGEITYQDLASPLPPDFKTSERRIYKIASRYLQRIGNNISGTQKNKISSDQKETLLKELEDYINIKLPHMTCLSYICWMLYLNCQASEKTLLQEIRFSDYPKINNEGGHWRLDIQALEHSWMDMVTYSDGILQLLENSCQHTYMQMCYLTLRIYYVDRNASESNLLQIAATRESLRKRYQRLGGLSTTDQWRLSQSAKFYFETTVIDDALDEPLPTTTTPRRGITSVYIQNMKNRAVSSEESLQGIKLVDIINDNTSCIQNHDTLVHHYGIAALRLTAARNNGGFIVTSPMPGNTSLSELVCVPPMATASGIKYSQISDARPFTEYHILFPLGEEENWQSNKKSQPNFPDLFDRSLLKNIKSDWVVTHKFKLENSEIIKSTSDFLMPEQKIDFVDGISSILNSKLPIPSSENEHVIYLLDTSNLNSFTMELLTKALFKHILNRMGDDYQLPHDGEQLYAIYFSTIENQWEFIRLFSIFYNRFHSCESSPETNPIAQGLENVQIALCSRNDSLGIPEVNFLLTGSRMASLYETARRFVYYNSESSLKLLSQIKYLSYDNSDSKKPGLAPFPFDLWLEDSMGPSDSSGSSAKSDTEIAKGYNCWFMQRIMRLLNKSLQEELLGLKIDNIHAHIQSSIHIDRFYEAELLFHNISILARFAYLITRRILLGRPLRSSILITGYESYSSLLVQYVKQYLQDALGDSFQIHSGMIYFDEYKSFQLMLDAELAEFKERSNFLINSDHIILYPIGTTLSTLHRMHECLKKNCGQSISVSNQISNIVLILVGNQPSESKNITERYWRKYKSNSESEATVGCYSNQQLARVEVLGARDNTVLYADYFLYVLAKWHDSADLESTGNCSGMEREQALVHTGRTATSLNMIFPLKATSIDYIPHHDVVATLFKGSEKFYEKQRKINNVRLQSLKGCIMRGHIAQGNNHFSIYLDLPRYLNNVLHNIRESDPASFSSWLTELHEKHFDPNAFNIIVSPLKKIGTYYVKSVIDHVFEHSSRFLHIDLQNARRGDIRAKYSYITRDYKTLRQSNPNIRINAYYIDDSLVTADTLQRGRSILHMLLSDNYNPSESPILFKGVFLLINRSSQDTIRDFVKNPDTDFDAFATLCIPHYNTKNNYCPACERMDRYTKLGVRSVTNLFYEEYQRSYEKHSLRHPQEYLHWQTEQLWYAPSSFARLRQWYAEADGQKNLQQNPAPDHALQIVDKYLNIMCRDFYLNFWRKTCERTAPYSDEEMVALLCKKPVIQQKFLREIGMVTLHRQLSQLEENSSLDRTAFRDVWIEYVLPERTMRRTIAAHEAYSCLKLEREKVNSSTLEKIIDTYLKNVSDILSSSPSPYDSWEWLFSCFKILSRDYVLRHHEIHVYMFNYLRNIADALLGRDCDLKKASILGVGSDKKIPSFTTSYCQEIDPLLRYQMFLSIMHLLANMQSNYPLSREVLSAIDLGSQRLTSLLFTQHKNESCSQVLKRWYLKPLPCVEQIAFDYEQCVKLSALSGDEQSKCLLIQRSQNLG